MEDDEQRFDENDPDIDRDREEAPTNPDIRIRQLSVAITSRPRRSHHVRRIRNSTTDGNDNSS